MFLSPAERDIGTQLTVNWLNRAESHRNSRCDLVRLRRREPVVDAPVRAYTGADCGGGAAVARRHDARS